jgi:exodeoxyribonuclease-3
MKIATWNVNSLTVRLPMVLDWLEANPVDILALQELKLTDDKFPIDVFVKLGYHVYFFGQKTYNGVALISRWQLTDCQKNMPAWDDLSARLISACLSDMRIINVYIPNGQSVESDKFQYKLTWLTQLLSYLKTVQATGEKIILLGDFNIAPNALDVHEPNQWEGGVLYCNEVRHIFEDMLSLGLIDTFRVLYPDTQRFTWWDYRMNAYRRKMGLRIDHILLSTQLTDKLFDIEIDEEVRKLDRPSDHAPVVMTLVD